MTINRSIWLSCSIIYILLLAPWLFIHASNSDMRVLNPATTDDAFFYLKPALYYANTGVFTFDGINATNGFHPVWMAGCVVFWKIMPGGISPLSAWTIYSFIVLAFHAAAFALCCFIGLRHLHPLSALASAGLLAHFRHTNIILYGLEPTLNVPLSLLLAIMIMHFLTHKRWANSIGYTMAVGATLGVWALTRLESLMALPVIALLLLFISRHLGLSWRAAFLRISLMTAATSAIVLIYLTWNYTTFGHLVPVSGQVKSTFPRPRLLWPMISLYPDHFFFLLANTAIILLGAFRFKRHDFPKGLFIGYACIYAGALINWLYTFLFVGATSIGWYFSTLTAATLLGGALAAYLARDFIPRRHPRAVAAAILAFGLAAGAQYDAYLYLRMKQMPGSSHRAGYEAALWIRDNLPPDAILAATDCGLVSYFSERRMVNIDGVSCSYEFLPYLKERRRDEFIRAKGVNHILATLQVSGDLARFDKPYQFAFPENVINTNETEVYRGRPFLHGVSRMMMIWQYTPTK